MAVPTLADKLPSPIRQIIWYTMPTRGVLDASDLRLRNADPFAAGRGEMK